MIDFIRKLKLCLLDLYVEKGEVRVSTPDYQRFYRLVHEFANKFKLYDNEDWHVIEKNLIHRECEYLVSAEAANIKCALDRLELLAEEPHDENDEYKYLHPSVRELAISRMESGCYADAVECAFKEINCRVKNLVTENGWEEKDGVQLMQYAFKVDDPIIKVDSSLSLATDHDIQQGYQFLFAGAISAIRNPKAHENLQITKTEAMRFLIFASTLMDKLDKCTVVKKRETCRRRE